MNFWTKNFLPFSDLVFPFNCLIFPFYGKNQLNQIKLITQKIKKLKRNLKHVGLTFTHRVGNHSFAFSFSESENEKVINRGEKITGYRIIGE
jgi:hypothetical protein